MPSRSSVRYRIRASSQLRLILQQLRLGLVIDNIRAFSWIARQGLRRKQRLDSQLLVRVTWMSRQTDSRASEPPKFLVVLSVRAVSFHPGEVLSSNLGGCKSSTRADRRAINTIRDGIRIRLKLRNAQAIAWPSRRKSELPARPGVLPRPRQRSRANPLSLSVLGVKQLPVQSRISYALLLRRQRGKCRQ
jgi:hypothetical protein